MAHEVEGAVDAGIAGAEDLVLGQVGEGIARGVGMAEEEELDALLAVVEHQLVVEDDVRDLERAVARRPCGRSARGRPPRTPCAPLIAQQPGAVGLGDDAGPRLGEDRVAVGVIAVVVRVEDIADRLIGRLLDRRDDIAGFLGEVGVDDDDVVLEDDPDVVAAAERKLSCRWR